MQVQASKYGLGATLLQGGRPVTYASKALTPSQVNYAQTEKEMYSILFAANRFYQYVFGRPVNVQTNHKPLVSISKKSIHAAPARLQGRLLDSCRSLTMNFNIYLPKVYLWLMPFLENSLWRHSLRYMQVVALIPVYFPSFPNSKLVTRNCKISKTQISSLSL